MFGQCAIHKTLTVSQNIRFISQSIVELNFPLGKIRIKYEKLPPYIIC